MPNFRSSRVSHQFFRLKLGIVGLLSAAGAVAVGASIAGFGGRYLWVLDLASHFRVQYLVTLLIVAAAMFALRSYRVASVFTAVALLNLVLVLQLYVGPLPEAGPRGRSLRAMLINVHTINTDHEAVLAAVKRHDPDFVVVEEVNQRWSGALRELEDQYQFVVNEPREDNFGIALLSKHPAFEANVLSVGDLGLPSVLAKFDLKGHRFFILGTHAVPPVSSEGARMRDQHLAALPRITAGLNAPVLLLGDLNASPWSYHFKRLLQDSGLRDASRGRGIQATWPTHMFPLLIPIDHCLHSPEIAIVDKTTGAQIGSDHYPVIVDFAFPSGQQPD